VAVTANGAAAIDLPRGERRDALAARRFDALIVGGGITGCGVALDLVARGLDVALVERGDYGGATSSASSRLIHGGLRYLEHHEFGFVREALAERSRLLALAPSLVTREPFYFPLRRGGRVSPPMLAAGLTLYGLLSLPRALGWPRLTPLSRLAAAVPGLDTSRFAATGYYHDAATHDAKLTFAVAAAAARRGAIVLPRVEALAIERDGSGATARLRDILRGDEFEASAKLVVLAGGPFADALRIRCGLAGGLLATTRGTHVVLRPERLRLAASLIFDSPLDGRVMFLLRWGGHVAIGTTDVDADPAVPVVATRQEVSYLLASANALLPGLELGDDDVLTACAGLRPLLRTGAGAGRNAPSARSREEAILEDGPFLTIAGGKLTGYRAIAEKVGSRVAKRLGKGSSAVASPTRDIALAAPEIAPSDDLDAIVDHAVRRLDVTSPGDLLVRRSDRGLLPHDAALALGHRVAERIADRLGVPAAARAAIHAAWEMERAERESWRT
jgi:glycerol-3-phosphate dehydrogenase